MAQKILLLLHYVAVSMKMYRTTKIGYDNFWYTLKYFSNKKGEIG